MGVEVRRWSLPDDVPDDARNRLRENRSRHERHPVQGPDDVGPEIASTLIRDIRAQGEFVTSVFNHRAALAANVGEPIQCRAGCSACCSDYAMVAPTDMLLLVDAYQKMSPDDQAYVREKNARWMEARMSRCSASWGPPKLETIRLSTRSK